MKDTKSFYKELSKLGNRQLLEYIAILLSNWIEKYSEEGQAENLKKLMKSLRL